MSYVEDNSICDICGNRHGCDESLVLRGTIASRDAEIVRLREKLADTEHRRFHADEQRNGYLKALNLKFSDKWWQLLHATADAKTLALAAVLQGK